MNDIIIKWNALTDQEKINTVTRCIKSAAMKQIGGGKALSAFYQRHELDELLSETWLKLSERMTTDYLTALDAHRAARGTETITMITVVYRAALDAIRTAQREDDRDARNRLEPCTDADGHEYNAVDSLITSRRHNTEVEAITRIMYSELMNGLDHTDRIIIEALISGYKQREAAQAVNISAPAVNKRVRRLRAAVTAAIA